VYRYLYSASHSISQTEHFSSRRKVRLKTRERDEERGRERIEERRGGERRFQRVGLIDAKNLVWAIVVITQEEIMAITRSETGGRKRTPR